MSVATAVYDQTCHICDLINKSIKTFFLNLQRGRQLSANSEIFKYQMHYDNDREYYLHKMNEHTNKEFDTKIKELWNKPAEYDGL